MESPKASEEKLLFLGQLYVQLKRSEIVYQYYMNHQKQFLFAKILKECNQSILQLLNSHSHVLSEDLMNDSLKLMTHLHIWMEKWIDLEKKQQPSLHDEFVFENEFSFPREAAQKLEKEFLALSKK
jgi:hypothetical protein